MEGWLTAKDLAEAVTTAGYPTTERQLERWRNARLLRSSTPGVSALHPPESVRRCIAIQRVLREKDDLRFALDVLWLAGFAVDRSVWRRAMNRADWLSGPFLRRVSGSVDQGFDSPATSVEAWVADLKGLPGWLAKISRKLPQLDQRAAFAGVMLEAARGEFVGFEHEERRGDLLTTKEMLVRGLALEQSERDAVLGRRLRLANALQPALANLSDAAGGPRARDLSDEELCAARDDARNALKAAFCLYQAMAWFIGKDALGLRQVAQLVPSLGLHIIAAFSPAVARLRRVPGAIIPSDTIRRMALEAEWSWNASNYFFQLQASSPQYRKICGPEAMKLAFRDSVSYAKFLESLSKHQFPPCEFRPWDLWRSTFKTKKMPSGLLVMSIGAPTVVHVGDIGPSAGEPLSR